MKRLLTLPLLLLSLFVCAQQTSRLIAGQSKPYRLLHPDNILYVDTLPGGEYRIWAVTIDSVLIKPHQMKWMRDSVVMIGNQRYVQLAGAYSNPTWVNSLSAGKVFGLSSVATTGDYGDLTNKPNLSLYYLNSNPSGYISGITGSLVTGALGYTPVNPNGTSAQYIAGDGTKPTFPTIPTNTNQLTNGAGFITSVPAQSFSSLTGKPTTLSGYGITDAYPLSGNPSGFLTSMPSGTISTTARTLNSNFTISSTKEARVSYSVLISVTNPLLAGNSTASAFLEYSTNAGSSWNIVSQASNSSGVALAVAIAITNIQTSVLSGVIPANALVRIRTTASGTSSVSFVSSQEVVY